MTTKALQIGNGAYHILEFWFEEDPSRVLKKNICTAEKLALKNDLPQIFDQDETILEEFGNSEVLKNDPALKEASKTSPFLIMRKLKCSYEVACAIHRRLVREGAD